jgi:hypothetical protein
MEQSCHREDSVMSRPTWKTLIASACILSFTTMALTPSSALAWGRGFGIGLGIGAIAGMAAASQPAPVYVERRPIVVAPAPVRSKTAESEKQSEKHHHKATHTADKEPVTRTMRQQPSPAPQPPVATNTKPTNDADLRKCLVKEYLPDDSVVFKDTCTQEQASTAKPTPAVNDTPKVTQSIQLEPAVAQDESPQPQQMDGP